MLYVFHGQDNEKVNARYRRALDGLLKKNLEVEVFYFDAENFDFSKAEELMTSRDLFQRKQIAVFRGCLKDIAVSGFILGRLKELSASENIFIFIEGKLTKDLQGKFSKAGGKTEEISGEAEEKRGFNPFSLADALGRRDKKEAWVLLQKVKNTGMAPEEIHGMIFWQFKNIALAKEYGARIPGVAPYPARKAADYAKKFTGEEIKEKLGEIVRIYHDARSGGMELDLAVEKLYSKKRLKTQLEKLAVIFGKYLEYEKSQTKLTKFSNANN